MPHGTALLGIMSTLIAAAADVEVEAKGCTITAAVCRNFPEFQRKQFRDHTGEAHLSTADKEAACLKRAEDFHHWCGNGAKGGGQVAATFNPGRLSQIYHPGACDEGWSQWDAFCFKHYWEKRNWFEAERLCRDRNAHLASIHSQAENRFVFALTKGLSAWIGYTDLDQDTHYKWSDNTQDDFSNFAKNCTGREHEPDCKPEEKAQQWYDWQGGDKGTFVCKRNALLPLALLRNVSAQELLETSWVALLPALAGSSQAEASSSLRSSEAALPTLRTQDILTTKADTTSKSPREPALGKPFAPEPRFGLPKGSLL